MAGHPGSYALGDAPLSIGGCTNYHALRLDRADGRGDGPVPVLYADQIVAIGFTSGSTGRPKPNPKSWASVRASSLHNARTLVDALALESGTLAHIVATVPPQHMYGLELSVLLPLLGPFAVHSGKPFFPADVAAALADVPAPRILVTTPIHLQALLRDPIELPPLGAITSATAPLSRELAAEAEARYGAPVVELFGSTETCVIAHRRTSQESAGIFIRILRCVRSRTARWWTRPTSISRSRCRMSSSFCRSTASTCVDATPIWSRSPASAHRSPTSRTACSRCRRHRRGRAPARRAGWRRRAAHRRAGRRAGLLRIGVAGRAAPCGGSRVPAPAAAGWLTVTGERNLKSCPRGYCWKWFTGTRKVAWDPRPWAGRRLERGPRRRNIPRSGA